MVGIVIFTLGGGHETHTTFLVTLIQRFFCSLFGGHLFRIFFLDRLFLCEQLNIGHLPIEMVHYT